MTADTNNLANANTTAFKAQRPVFQAEPLYGQGLPDRVNVDRRAGHGRFQARARSSRPGAASTSR